MKYYILYTTLFFITTINGLNQNSPEPFELSDLLQRNFHLNLDQQLNENLKTDILNNVNPFLAQSAWPIAHGNTWNSDSDLYPGPTSKDSNFQAITGWGDFFSFMYNNPISMVMTSDNKYYWAHSYTGVYKVRLEEDQSTVVGYLKRELEGSFHGAYSLVTSDGIYYAAGEQYFAAYGNKDASNPESEIVELKKFEIPDMQENEHLVGLSMTYDGYIVWLSNYGRCGVVSLDMTFSSNIIQLPGLDLMTHKNKHVSNSFAIDQAGSIYIVTAINMNNVHWDPVKKAISLTWSTPYHDKEMPTYWGRFGPGSGSSPTLGGDLRGTGKADYVVVTDGYQDMNILFFKTEDGTLLGNHSVTFGRNTSTTNEQSVVVWNNRAVVPNNWFYDEEVDKICFVIKDAYNTGLLPPTTSKLVQWCPFLLGQASLGVEQFEIDPVTFEVKSTWSRQDVSCTSSIPVVSESNEILYCVGHREHGGFTLEALDWKTGEQVFYKTLGSPYNPFGCGIEIGKNRDVIAGTLFGPVRVTDADIVEKDSVEGIDDAVDAIEMLMSGKIDWSQLLQEVVSSYEDLTTAFKNFSKFRDVYHVFVTEYAERENVIDKDSCQQSALAAWPTMEYVVKSYQTKDYTDLGIMIAELYSQVKEVHRTCNT